MKTLYVLFIVLLLSVISSGSALAQKDVTGLYVVTAGDQSFKFEAMSIETAWPDGSDNPFLTVNGEEQFKLGDIANITIDFHGPIEGPISNHATITHDVTEDDDTVVVVSTTRSDDGTVETHTTTQTGRGSGNTTTTTTRTTTTPNGETTSTTTIARCCDPDKK